MGTILESTLDQVISSISSVSKILCFYALQATQKSLVVVLGVIRSHHMSLHKGWHGNDNFRISTLLLCAEVGVQEGYGLGQGDCP